MGRVYLHSSHGLHNFLWHLFNLPKFSRFFFSKYMNFDSHIIRVYIIYINEKQEVETFKKTEILAM